VSEEPSSPAPPSSSEIRSGELRLTVPRELMMRPTARQGIGRAPVIFAVIGVLVALGAVGFYVLRQTTAPPPRSPEETVSEFLSAVFLSADPQRTGDVVCKSWDASDAVSRTAKEIPDGAHVSWDELMVVAKSDTKVTIRARLGLRLVDDIRPSSYEQWRFSLVKEDGWRVCEARPFTV